jgi:hypothetical protein
VYRGHLDRLVVQETIKRPAILKSPPYSGFT